MKQIKTALWSAALILGLANTAIADSTTGKIRGTILDTKGKPVDGASVTATSPALQQAQTAFTSNGGQYYLASLPIGVYTLTVAYGNKSFVRKNVPVRIGKEAFVSVRIDTSIKDAETVVVKGSAPMVDLGSTKGGIVIDSDFTSSLPSQRTWSGTLDAAPSTQTDAYGQSVLGSTSPENVYVVEGINTTDPMFADRGTDLPNEFIRETEVITSGYSAEYGRSSGGVINVATKSGSNEFHGSLYSYFTPGGLTASADSVSVAGTAVEQKEELRNAFDVGWEVGGPIIKDHLWFHVGFNPSLRQTNVNRIINTQTDRFDPDGNEIAGGDGLADLDANGLPILEEVDRTILREETWTYFFTGKVTGAINENHQGNVSFFGNPSNGSDWLSVNGVAQSSLITRSQGAFDISGKWTSKFNEGKTQVDLVAGWHRSRDRQAAALTGGESNQVVFNESRSLTDFETTVDACQDGGPNDPFPNIVNCPTQFYGAGGVGFIGTRTSDRASVAGSITQRIDTGAAGNHIVKAGLDFENLSGSNRNRLSGGSRIISLGGGTWVVHRLFTPVSEDEAMALDPNAVKDCGIDLDQDGFGDAQCAFQENGLTAETTTRNMAAYLQDSWQIRPNLTVNAGLRWERQQLLTADALHGKPSPVTGDPIPETAFTIGDAFAPRVGVIYDWTNEGKSRVYAHYGRFYESIPQDLNVRGFGGEVFNVNVLLGDDILGPGACSASDPVGTCDPVDNLSVFQLDVGGGQELVQPGMNGQHLDEVVLGTDYEVIANTKVGATFMYRDLKNVIEDVSPDGGNNFIIANPGKITDQGEIDRIRAEGTELMDSTDPVDQQRGAFMVQSADWFQQVGLFDKPKRTYVGLELHAEHRFSRNFFARASYTWSRLEGNFPGLFSPDTLQLDPNFTSIYDLPELMANRNGRLPGDRNHLMKLDAYYRYAHKKLGRFVFGASIRGRSGRPGNTLASSIAYGPGESFLLPRGTADRTEFLSRTDAHVSYGRSIGKGRVLEAFVDVFNVFNQQAVVTIDENYTTDNVNPIVGGSAEDLAHAKIIDFNTGLPGAQAPTVQDNFGNARSRQAPLSMRFGARVSF